MVEPARIVCDGGHACGVVTSEGEHLNARRFVVSSLDPQQTFLDLLEERDVPGEVRARAADFRYNLIAPLFSLNLNLREAPRYQAAAAYPGLDRAFMVIMGLDHVDQYP